jgi:integrase
MSALFLVVPESATLSTFVASAVWSLRVTLCAELVAAGVAARCPAEKAAEPMATRKRRGPKHPGVVLIKPNAAKRMGWRVRYVDPDTERTVYKKLPAHLTTVEQREQHAVDKSRDNAKRRLELETGAARASGLELKEALERYFKAHPQLRERTLKIYRTAATKLEQWAPRAAVRSADDLTRPKLMAFREAVIREPKRVPAENGQRGAFVASAGTRSPAAINQDLRSIRTVLGYLRDLDLLARLSHDDLRRALKRLPTTGERVEYLKPHQLQKLLESARAHDLETFAETRDEHTGKRPVGTTPRYQPIAPLIAFVLLTGCRIGEAIGLTWDRVDLPALDHEGRAVGEIHLSGESTKTKRARTVGLEVSPTLRKMLATMHLASGGKGPVFAFSRTCADAAAKRLRSEYGGPAEFSWQALRRTCAVFLTNAPAIFGAASAYRSAKQLGHSVQVAERHYVDVARGISPAARTLDAAMLIEEELAKIVAQVAGAQQPAARVVGLRLAL